MSLRLHVVSLPHTQTTRAFSVCAYTEKVRKFCRMMHERGHEVFLYAGEENEAPCTEHVACIPETVRRDVVGDKHYVEANFDPTAPHWQMFNARAATAIRARAQPHDFVCLIGGAAQKPIADALPELLSVEFGIGYSGTFANYRVYESYAWMHACYGANAGRADLADGRWFDAVIPNYFELEDFPLGRGRGGYYAYFGRLVERKGWQIAVDVCKALDVELLLAGPGEPPPGVKHLGVLGPAARAEFLGNARALFVPTHYLEPFGGVAVEAMLCGTPVLTSDWGAFTETVEHGVTGYRCRTFAEFLAAAAEAPDLSRAEIQRRARRYSLDSIAPLYETFFERLLQLWGRGWYEGRP